MGSSRRALGPFLDDPIAPTCAALRRIFTIGEPLTAGLRDQFFQRFSPRVELHNLYGPTEAAVEVTHYQCLPDVGLERIPIGRPIANSRVYVLDERRRPQPIGVQGELYVGGVCVARGYLNQPELTAERFVPDPFDDAAGTASGTASARLYRTGDRGRWRADGTLEFFGRLDDQVKIRGVRVEPGEVEAALRRHPGVADAAVVAIEEPAGGASLAAYVVPRNGSAPLTEAALRSFAASELSETSVPSTFVTLDAIPVSTSGKLDRPRPSRHRDRAVRAGGLDAPPK